MASLAEPSSARRALQLATTHVHERLHVAEPFLKIAEGSLDLAGYVSLLKSVLRFHETLQPVLAWEVGIAPLLDGGERIRLLRENLTALGAASEVPAIKWVPPVGEGAAIGCLYVVQGSAIGGRVIYGQLDYLFRNERRGRSFFAGTGKDSLRWQAVRALLEQEVSEERLEAMIEGAQSAFALFETCLDANH